MSPRKRDLARALHVRTLDDIQAGVVRQFLSGVYLPFFCPYPAASYFGITHGRNFSAQPIYESHPTAQL